MADYERNSVWDGVEDDFTRFKKEHSLAWGLLKVGTVGLAALILGLSTPYTVAPDEEGVVRRFGKYVRSTGSGLHFKLPFLIEDVTKVKVKEVKKEEFGFRTKQAGVRTIYEKKDYSEESLMLTGDESIVDLEFIVQYKIKNAADYLFNVRDVRGTLRDAAEAAMRQVIGDRGVDDALTTGKEEVQEAARKKVQELMDNYGTGVHIGMVKLQDVYPPEEVRAAFDDVNTAKQNRTEIVNKAWEEYNKIIPRAKGEAEQMVQEAEAYAVKRVNEAKGDANKFLEIWNKYKLAQDVTRKRLYLETLQEVLPKIKDLYIIDVDASGGLLKFLDVSGNYKSFEERVGGGQK